MSANCESSPHWIVTSANDAVSVDDCCSVSVAVEPVVLSQVRVIEVVLLVGFALATTAELFALAWSALRRGIGELAIAGFVGSAAYNSTATLGVAGLVHPLRTHGVVGAAWLGAALPLAVIALGGRRARIGRLGGGLLAVTYVVYVTVVLA